MGIVIYAPALALSAGKRSNFSYVLHVIYMTSLNGIKTREGDVVGRDEREGRW